MYTNFDSILKEAYEKKKAIGSFNWYNFETLKGIIEAGDELNTPVIASFGAKYLTNMDLDTAVALTKVLAEKVNIPVCLHLDHSEDIEVVKSAIKKGFGSVMYDGSKLSFEENLKNTKEICELAHKYNVCVEAELGSLASGVNSHEGTKDDKEVYTNPLLAKKFVEETGVDALAVSIGTVHGMYKGTPNIRVDILEEINKEVNSPLVLHGGSGTPEDKLISCINNGISKINVNTEISEHVIANTRELLKEKSPHFSVLSLKQKDYVKEVVKKYITLFNN